MMLIVGAHTLLGQNLILKLNKENFNYLVLASAQIQPLTEFTHINHLYHVYYDNLTAWVKQNAEEVEFIFWCDDHAPDSLFTLLWKQCTQYQIPFIFTTNNSNLLSWSEQQKEAPFFWVGLHIETIYGMAFSSSNEAFTEDHLLRNLAIVTPASLKQSDQQSMTYVQDVVHVIYFLVRHRQNSGCYHLPQQQILLTTFRQLLLEGIQDTFSTQAEPWSPDSLKAVKALRAIGYREAFRTLTEGIEHLKQTATLNDMYK